MTGQSLRLSQSLFDLACLPVTTRWAQSQVSPSLGDVAFKGSLLPDTPFAVCGSDVCDVLSDNPHRPAGETRPLVPDNSHGSRA